MKVLLFVTILSIVYASPQLSEQFVLHDVDATSAVFTPDGSRFVVVGHDAKVRTYTIDGTIESVWNARDYINCVDISPDGQFLAIGGDGFTFEILKWETNSWTLFQSFSAPLNVVSTLKKHDQYTFLLGKVVDVSFSPSSRPGYLAVGSGGWEAGIVALIELDTGKFKHVDTFSGLFTKWAISTDLHSIDGKHILTASPDQAISILELEPSDMMKKEAGAEIEWYTRDDHDRWQLRPVFYNPTEKMTELHRLSNNIQNHITSSTNNFVRMAKWLKTSTEFVTVGHEGHVRVYKWCDTQYNATHHFQDTIDGTPIAAVSTSTFQKTPYFVTVSHGRHVNVVAFDSVDWVHVQRVVGGVEDEYSGGRGVAISPDGCLVVVVGRSIAMYNVVDGSSHVDVMERLKLDTEIRSRHYRIE